jgi:hypothetical protein
MAASKRTSGATRKGSRTSRGTSTRAHQAQLARLKRRTADLLLAYLGARGRPPSLPERARRLKRDIDDWRDRTGDRHIRATATRLNDNTDPDDWSCDSCDWIHIDRFDRLCFFVACDPDYNQCSYICIQLPKDPNPPVS